MIALLKPEHGVYTLEIHVLLEVDRNFTSLDTAAPAAPARTTGSIQNPVEHNLHAYPVGTGSTT